MASDTWDLSKFNISHELADDGEDSFRKLYAPDIEKARNINALWYDVDEVQTRERDEAKRAKEAGEVTGGKTDSQTPICDIINALEGEAVRQGMAHIVGQHQLTICRGSKSSSPTFHASLSGFY